MTQEPQGQLAGRTSAVLFGCSVPLIATAKAAGASVPMLMLAMLLGPALPIGLC